MPGTPTFFINGQMHLGSDDFQTMLTTLEQAAGAGTR
ncbi:MAG: DsbA family protein [Ktedonobacterales bacterium]